MIKQDIHAIESTLQEIKDYLTKHETIKEADRIYLYAAVDRIVFDAINLEHHIDKAIEK